MTSQSLPLSALPYFPLNPAWIEQSAAFRHEDAGIGLGQIKLLFAAFRGLPAGSIPASHAYIAQTTGLPQEIVGANFKVLTEGFELNEDSRLYHVQLAQLAGVMNERYGKEIEDFALSSMMAAQSPDQFKMVATEKASAQTKGKRALPKTFGLTMFPELNGLLQEVGYPTQEDRDWIVARFIDKINTKNSMSANWPVECKLWASNEVMYGRLPPSRQSQPARQSGFAGRVSTSRADAVRQANAGAFGRKLEPQSGSSNGSHAQGGQNGFSTTSGGPRPGDIDMFNDSPRGGQ